MANVNDLYAIQKGNERVPGAFRTSAGGNIPKGARSISIANMGAANGTVDFGNGACIIKPDEVKNMDAAAIGDTLPEAEYDGSGTDLLILTLY